jgi:hypothetical protein
MLELLPKFGRKNSWTYLKKFVHFPFTPNWMAPFLWICKAWRHSWHIPACISRFSRMYTKSFSIALPVAGVNLVSASHFHFNLERLFMICCFPYGVQCWLASKSLMCPAILHDVPYMMCPVTSLFWGLRVIALSAQLCAPEPRLSHLTMNTCLDLWGCFGLCT